MNTPQFDKLIPILVSEGVQFILIGGVAGILHGAARFTYDVDIVYARSRDTTNVSLKHCPIIILIYEMPQKAFLFDWMFPL